MNRQMKNITWALSYPNTSTFIIYLRLLMWNYPHEHSIASIINYHQISPCFWLIWFGHLESSTFPNMEGFSKYREVLDFPNWTNQGGSWHSPTATPKCSTLCEWLIDRLQNWRKFLLRILSQNSLQQSMSGEGGDEWNSREHWRNFWKWSYSRKVQPGEQGGH